MRNCRHTYSQNDLLFLSSIVYPIAYIIAKRAEANSFISIYYNFTYCYKMRKTGSSNITKKSASRIAVGHSRKKKGPSSVYF